MTRGDLVHASACLVFASGDIDTVFLHSTSEASAFYFVSNIRVDACTFLLALDPVCQTNNNLTKIRGVAALEKVPSPASKLLSKDATMQYL